MKVLGMILGFIVSVSLLCFGIFFPMPKKFVFVSEYTSYSNNKWVNDRGAEYVGGDAYNYQIEASLKAGYACGVMTMKTITSVAGAVLLVSMVIVAGNERIRRNNYIAAMPPVYIPVQQQKFDSTDTLHEAQDNLSL